MIINRIRTTVIPGRGVIYGERLIGCEPPSMYFTMAGRKFLEDYVHLLRDLGFNRSATHLFVADEFQKLQQGLLPHRRAM